MLASVETGFKHMLVEAAASATAAGVTPKLTTRWKPQHCHKLADVAHKNISLSLSVFLVCCDLNLNLSSAQAGLTAPLLPLPPPPPLLLRCCCCAAAIIYLSFFLSLILNLFDNNNTDIIPLLNRSKHKITTKLTIGWPSNNLLGP